MARRSLISLLVTIICLGVGFRLFKLDGKLYWHDEVYTSMRAAGFTRSEIDQELFQNRLVLAPDLQKYQHPKPSSAIADTINSLAIEDPQHPPLYFVMARFWMQHFGSSLVASRSLPALLSLLALPFMYGLALELFTSHFIAVIATAFLAISPFDVLFAQTARQYSLLTVTVIASSLYLLKAVRSPPNQQKCHNWLFYILASTLGLYTHPFFALTLIGQISFVGLYWWRTRRLAILMQFAGTLTTIFILYLPWINILFTNRARALSTTDWARVAVGWVYLLKLWVLSFTSLFFDLDFGFDNIWTYLFRLPFVLLIGWSIYTLCLYGRWSTKWFILTAIIVPFLCLALPDLIIGGKRSATSRYLISCFPAVQLTVAYWFGRYPRSLSRFAIGKQIFWQTSLALLLAASIMSCTVSAFSRTWWSKDLSYFNTEVANLINSITNPLVISDIGDDYTNTGDLISLSYLLHNDVKLLLLSQTPQLDLLKNFPSPFVFRPSQRLRHHLEPQYGQLQLIFPAGQIWQLQRS